MPLYNFRLCSLGTLCDRHRTQEKEGLYRPHVWLLVWILSLQFEEIEYNLKTLNSTLLFILSNRYENNIEIWFGFPPTSGQIPSISGKLYVGLYGGIDFEKGWVISTGSPDRYTHTQADTLQECFKMLTTKTLSSRDVIKLS